MNFNMVWLAACRLMQVHRKKMYKRKLKQWGHTKYIKLGNDEERSLLRVDYGSGTHFDHRENQARHIRLRNGQLVSTDRLEAHLRRRPGWTSANGPLTARAVRPPHSLYLSEAILFQVHKSIHGRWGDTCRTGEHLDMMFEGPAESSVSTPRSKSPGAQWNSLAHSVKFALKQKRLNDALFLMRRAPHVLMQLIQSHGATRPMKSPETLFTALSFFTFGKFLNPEETEQLMIVVKHLIAFAAAFAAQTLPSHDWLRQLLATLSSVDAYDLQQLLTKAWRVACQSFDALMDCPRSTKAIAGWISYGDFMGFDAMPSELGEIIELTLSENAAKYGEDQ